MFIAALFTVDKTWKQPKCPLTDEWIKKMWHKYIYTHTGILFSHRKEWNNAIWGHMDGPRDYHTKWSKSDKDKFHITYKWNLKNNTNVLIYRTETTHRHRKQTHGYHRGMQGRGINLEFGINRYTLLYIK